MLREKYPHTDKIKLVLKGKSDLVEQHGLNYLIPVWQRFANHYADTTECIYEWQNDMDARSIIDEILAILSIDELQKIEQILKPIDDKVITKTFEINECVWGSENEREENYNRLKHWYYYRVNDKIFESEGGRFTKRH